MPQLLKCVNVMCNDITVSNGIFEYYDVDDERFLELASSYGHPVKSRSIGGVIDTLITQSSEQVKKDSLSKRYGTDEFPIHTDGAYLKIPPRYILLKYVGEIKMVTPTVVVHFELHKLNEDEIDFVKNRIWYVKGQNGGFYSKILQGNILRYDKEVMKLVNPVNDAMESILSKMNTTVVTWQKNKVAVIDNYSVLHYRPKVSEKEKNTRILQRINIL